ncbi:acid protease [Stipitochalara longipes BDJ]|nr:acid protease [Stipitochalara longipes BDJ]
MDVVQQEFLVTIGIGTPSQNVTVGFDTGSSDLWLFGPDYLPGKSTTSRDQRRGDRIEYGANGTNTTGEYYSDIINFEGTQLQDQQFLIANATNHFNTGLMGVGLGASFFNNAAFTANHTFQARAPNIVDQMAAQNIISSRAFSLAVGNETEGSIIFGGLDTKKYIGTLGKYPMIPWESSLDKTPRYWLNMTSMAVLQRGWDTRYPPFNAPVTVFLDSASSISYLPPQLVQPLVDATNAQLYSNSNNIYHVDCYLWDELVGNWDGSVEFGFGNLTINVPVKQLLIPDSGGSCTLAIGRTNDPLDIPYVLGETFLRSAFVVFDQDNQNIHLAQGANCGTNLVPISKGVDAVPSLQGDCAGPIVGPIVATTAMVASTAQRVSTAAPKPTAKPITTRPKATSKVGVPVRSTKTKVTKKPGATGFVDGSNQ